MGGREGGSGVGGGGSGGVSYAERAPYASKNKHAYRLPLTSSRNVAEGSSISYLQQREIIYSAAT